MTKRLVEIDDDDLRAAQAALRTTTTDETVGRALRAVVAGAARRREVERLTSGSLAALADPDARRELWRQLAGEALTTRSTSSPWGRRHLRRR